MTADDFERGYAERSGVTVAWLREQGRVVLPCFCDEMDCPRWQSINRDLASEEVKRTRPWERVGGSVCKGCNGWIEDGTPYALLEIPPQPDDYRFGEPLYDGAVLARAAMFHERCAPAPIGRLLA